MKVQIPSEKKSKIAGKNLPRNREEKPMAKDHETGRIKNEGANTIGEEVEDCRKNLLRNREEKPTAKVSTKWKLAVVEKWKFVILTAAGGS
ncbi:Hypothetical predicted protein [Olea europaea subsp. europaea]|uniref:Uncharacterized protein n=1 Tax=Olea europaea subsp. europaea TaxID=158383 RepID=A0A8S0TBE9_OLEEU|nr:Hypothetical predicted protein [Olea europaea subsp. europaea]